jgi:hypothetical protein
MVAGTADRYRLQGKRNGLGLPNYCKTALRACEVALQSILIDILAYLTQKYCVND